ncbi:MAG: carbon starvation protein A [Puniceicoccaceae bacterium]
MIYLLVISIVFFWLAFKYFGGFMDRRTGLTKDRETPAHTLKDGVDYVPTRASILFGHHFSSIAGAGPIVGPILAAMYFGWGPTWLWILFGAAFVGGLHDYGAAVISVRTGGKSIAEAMRSIVGQKTGRLFALFVLCALIYVMIVFLDLTAATFENTPSVATASGWFITTALVFGVVLTRTKLPFLVKIAIFVPVTYAGLAVGHFFPAPVMDAKLWAVLILVYCYVAAILPVQVLLQPRDFLSSTFLYVLMIVGLLSVLVSSHAIQIDTFSGWNHPDVGFLVPFLFITVACGACSGFHSIVSSGTTSKQMSCETDIRKVNYGGMLVEGVLAVFALGTIAILTEIEREAAGPNPTIIFATGASKFMASVGLPQSLAMEFTLLAVSTFLLTTLDTCTRLSRFIMEEFLQVRSPATRWLGTAAVLIGPALAVFVQIDGQPAWRVVWPLFGSTNQLMAAMALLTFLVYLKSRAIKYGFVLPATVIMVIMPLWALVLMAINKGPFSLLGGIATVMLILGGFVTAMSLKFVLDKQPAS